MKLRIFLLLLAYCFYLATARPNDIDFEEKSQPAAAGNSENEGFVDGYSQLESEFEIGNDSDNDWLGDVTDTKDTVDESMDRVGKKPLHELAELLYSDYGVSKSAMIESLEQLQNSFEITMLKKSTEMYKKICDYVKNTQLRDNNITRPDTYEVDEIFKVHRHEEVSRYGPYERNFNRQLLFHGTPIENVVGILKNGLKISPPEAKCRGSVFGRGIYFSDTVSFSAFFCKSNAQLQNRSYKGFGIVFLCEVALGTVDIRYEVDGSQLKDHCDSVQALGNYYPHPLHIQPDGLKIPNGVLLQRNPLVGPPFNQFIVSDEARVKIRYLVKLKFNF